MSSIISNKVLYKDKSYLRAFRVASSIIGKNATSIFRCIWLPLLSFALIAALSAFAIVFLPVTFLFAIVPILLLSYALVKGAAFGVISSYIENGRFSVSYGRNAMQTTLATATRLLCIYLAYGLIVCLFLAILIYTIPEGFVMVACIALFVLLFVLTVPFAIAEVMVGTESDKPIHQSIKLGLRLGTRYWGTSALVLLFSGVISIAAVMIAGTPATIMHRAFTESLYSFLLGDQAYMPGYTYALFLGSLLLVCAVGIVMNMYVLWTMVVQTGAVMRRNDDIKLIRK